MNVEIHNEFIEKLFLFLAFNRRSNRNKVAFCVLNSLFRVVIPLTIVFIRIKEIGL